MPTAPSLGIPELAGITTYAAAARVGYSVEENVRRLVRLHWVERRLMAAAVAHLPATPEWEVKCALALHQWQDAEHAEALRRRVSEMRSPPPRMDAPPDAALDAFLEEVLRARDTVELLTGLYRVARRELVAAYRRHVAETNPLVDHPTRRLVRMVLLEDEEALDWGERALAALLRTGGDGAAGRSAAWEAHLRSYLAAAGGVAGRPPGRDTAGAPPEHHDTGTPDADPHRANARDIDPSPGAARAWVAPPESHDGASASEHHHRNTATDNAPLPPSRATTSFTHDLRPRRDARFGGLYNFNFPPHLVYNAEHVPADERNLALLCKRTLEMDVPEMMASIMVERRDQPWEFHLDFARQLWDEARHAMMGTVAFEARGVDWTRIPLNIGFSLRLNLHATPLERQLMLYAIEQSLMPGETGKRFEYETAAAASDGLSAHFHDYDWADEVLHAQIGRRWIKHEGIPVPEALERARAVHDKTWAALQQYASREPQRDWWGDFVRAALGKPSEARPEELGELKIIAE